MDKGGQDRLVRYPLGRWTDRTTPVGLSMSTGVRPVLTVHATWQPIEHYTRRVWVLCVGCSYSAVNSNTQLRGWQETVNTPRRFRCPECAA